MPIDHRIGASPKAIQAHYDVGNDFYELWLDPTMTYSCALWSGEDDTLEAAQARKLDYHVERARVRGAKRVLDIGCGWGSGLRRVVGERGVDRVVGLTLSPAQAARIAAKPDERIEVRTESWADHVTAERYDAMLCIGALEHFARPDQTPEERADTYRRFFSWCRDNLQPNGWLSIQTIAFGYGKFIPDSPLAEVFPESHLPRLSELAESFDRLFEVETIQNDASDYVRTLDAWLQRLEARWDDAVATTSEETVERYRRYLQFSRMGFSMGVFSLLRLSLKAIPPRKR